ncbi:MAG: TorD/DmsD family molecular chaperone [Syntrophobacteraceae bacterium]
MDIPAFNELGFHRKLMYDVLSELFSKKPDEQFLEKLNTEGLFDFLGRTSLCKEIADRLKIAVENLLVDKVKAKGVCEEFENLFLIPVADTYIPPIASAFMGQESRVDGFGRLSEELTTIYGAYGARFSEGKEGVFVFHPDHVTTLFNFMSFLIEREDGCFKESPILFNDIVCAEKRFFECFIESWINIFLGELRQRAFSDFYKLIAAITEKHVSNENSALGVFHSERRPRANGK